LIDEIYWNKGAANGAAWGNYPNSPRIRAQHENIYVFGTGKLSADSDISWQEWSRLTTSIWEVAATVDLSQHPAQMPVEIARRLVSLYTPKNGTVLDPFMGSGTTAIACMKMKRKFIGIEIEQKFFDLACRRIESHAAQHELVFVGG
jgi:site-specific DNA-methyltransferase (adenine-specific)